MTREEAKEILTHNWTRVDNPNYSESELNEAFFMAIEALSEPSIVRCMDCRHAEHCHETVAHTRLHDGFQEHWSAPIEWCSRGERKGGDDDGKD